MESSAKTQLNLRAAKTKLCNGEQVFPGEAPADLLLEWQASIDLGMSHELKSLTSDNLDKGTLDRISTELKEYKAFLSDFYLYQSKVLGDIGCAVFYLDSQGAVYNKGGNEALLAELKQKGVKFSTSFSQKSIGVHVANIAKLDTDTLLRRFGEENFLDLFCDYVCYARTMARKDMKNVYGLVLILMPVELYSQQTESVVLGLYETEILLNSKSYLFPAAQRRIGIVELAASCGQDAFIVIDTEGTVLFINDAFERRFGKTETECRDKPLVSLFPDLDFSSHSLSRGAPPLREVVLKNHDGAMRTYFAEYLIVRDASDTVVGMKILLKKVSQIQKYASEFSKLYSAQYILSDLKGRSPAFMRAITMAQRTASMRSNVLITGESGSGKELFAHAIHNASSRRRKPFIPINCAAIPSNLIASELFGYEDGAFTGAKKGGHAGKFEQANGGTIFLDEIAEMPFDMQASLLRVLEDNIVSRVGGKKYIPVDVRVISATNKDLLEYIKEGKFRHDLYYRLNVIKINVPSLRERDGDVDVLTDYILDSLSADSGKDPPDVSGEVRALLNSYSWPGNIRELRNILEWSVNFAVDGCITTASLPSDFIDGLSRPVDLPSASIVEPTNLPVLEDAKEYDEYEKQLIRRLMVKHKGNKSAVANEIGISRSTLYRKLKHGD